MKPFHEVAFAAGSTDSDAFPGHWDEQVFHVVYNQVAPGFGGVDPAAVRVIVSAHSSGDPATHTCAPGAFVERILPTGFEIHAMNTDDAGGSAGFNWIALVEDPPRGLSGDHRGFPPLRMGLTQPQAFYPTAQLGDWSIYGVPFAKPLPADPPGDFPIRLACGTDHGNEAAAQSFFDDASDPFGPYPQGDITGAGLGPTEWTNKTIGAVPATMDNFAGGLGAGPGPENGVTIIARNQNGERGKCAFYYLAVGREQQRIDSRDFQVASGTTLFSQSVNGVGSIDDSALALGPTPIDIAAWHVYFDQPFQTPPVVLAAVNDRIRLPAPNDGLDAVPVLVQAHDVTPYGFTLFARNVSDRLGYVCCDWVAIGCAPGCV